MIYLDSCALTKLIRAEDESEALQQWLDERSGVPHVTSELARAELPRVLRRQNHTAQGTVIDGKALRNELTAASDLLDAVELVLLVHVLLPGRGLAVRPLLLYYAVRYYHEHPEARAELGGEEGVQRIRRGELHDVADADAGDEAPALSDSDPRHT